MFCQIDPAGFSMKDLESWRKITRCNSTRPLYPLRLPAASAFLTGASTLWHRRLGHPGVEALSKLGPSLPSCNKELSTSLCHVRQLGRHTRLPFSVSTSRASNDLVHCDIWMPSIISVSGYKYYLVMLDDCSHHLWTFPLCFKYDTFLWGS